jgi:hypothetical protein
VGGDASPRGRTIPRYPRRYHHRRRRGQSDDRHRDCKSLGSLAVVGARLRSRANRLPLQTGRPSRGRGYRCQNVTKIKTSAMTVNPKCPRRKRVRASKSFGSGSGGSQTRRMAVRNNMKIDPRWFRVITINAWQDKSVIGFTTRRLRPRPRLPLCEFWDRRRLATFRQRHPHL